MVKDGPQAQVALQGTEGFLDVTELHIAAPYERRILGGHVGSQEVSALALAHSTQLFAVEAVSEDAVLAHVDFHQVLHDSAGSVLRDSELFQELVPGQIGRASCRERVEISGV